MTTVYDPVAWWARVDGERIALIDASSGQRHTYAEVHAAADVWSARLTAWGVRHGDRVAVLARNRVEHVALLFGCIRRGAMLVPLNWRLAQPELTRVLQDCEPVVVIGEERWRALAEEAIAACGASPPRWIDIGADLVATTESSAAQVATGADDDAMLLYTSGSTGAPKGVMVPHRQLLWNAMATTNAWALGADDVGIVATPFFHTAGWHVFTTPLLWCGGTVVIVDVFDASTFVEVIDKWQVTVAFAVPTQFADLLSSSAWGKPLPHLRTFICGGAPCPPRVAAAVRVAGYPFREAYGLTECGPNCFVIDRQTALDKPGSVGWPMIALEMRLRDGDIPDVATDVIGEIEVRGPQLFAGYFRAPALTAESMTADGWLRTGDLASRDARGVYTIRGRRKEMFISGGENVFPGEVEAAMLDCPGVQDVAVIGVADERWGEVGLALVVRSTDALSEATLLAAVRQRLAGYKVPARVHFVPSIPRLGSGKLDRRAIAEMASGLATELVQRSPQ